MSTVGWMDVGQQLITFKDMLLFVIILQAFHLNINYNLLTGSPGNPGGP